MWPENFHFFSEVTIYQLYYHNLQLYSTMNYVFITILLIAILILLAIQVALTLIIHCSTLESLIRSRHIRLPVVHQVQPNHYWQSFRHSHIPSPQIQRSIDLGNMPMAMYYDPSYYDKHSISNNSNFSIPLSLPGTNSNSANDRTRHPETIRRSLGTECFGDTSSIHTTLTDVAWETIELQEMESVV